MFHDLPSLMLLFLYNLNDIKSMTNNDEAFINQCQTELNEEIEYHKLKGLSTQLTIYMLYNGYCALLCDKAYCKSLKKAFRTKRNMLKKMMNDINNE